MLKSLFYSLCMFSVLTWTASAQAVDIPITNHSFQNPSPGGDGNAFDEDAFDLANGNPLPTGWSFVNSANDNYGQQRPHPNNHFTRDIIEISPDIFDEFSPFTQGGFDGDLIMFANMNGVGDTHRADSAVVGQLQQGIYTATAAVGGRNTGSWNDINYTVGLYGAVSGDLGSTLVTIDPGASANNTASSPWTTDAYNVVDVSFVLNVPAGSPLIGEDFGIRITAANSGFRGGVENGGFTQAAFDNARLDFVIPEPTSLLLLSLCAIGFGCTSRQRRISG